ncbi:MAG TPA: dihydropyrimidinase [Devosia sp.]
MNGFDTVICGGTVVTAGDSVPCDVGIRDGVIVALGRDLPGGTRRIDATGRLVLPGGIDAHCHIDQRSSAGGYTNDTWESGTRAGLAGGTTMLIPFVAQVKGQSLHDAVRRYHELADGKARSDYAFHLIVSDPTDEVLDRELPALIEAGYTSIKIYLTYEPLKLDDRQSLRVLETARREGALTMIHAENHEIIAWLTEKLVAAGRVRPEYHRVAHADVAESEGASRVIALAEVADVPVLIVHVSAQDAIAAIRRAQGRGQRVYAETCPQYLFLTETDLVRSGWEGAKCLCSPPPRDAANQELVWNGLIDGTFQIFSSDHAAYRFDGDRGKFSGGFDEATAGFHKIANGVPGLELRLPLLFSEGVLKDRISLNRFVELSATNAAKLYGVYPKKGTIAVGADADIAIWDPGLTRTVSIDMLHDDMDYTPYEGRVVTGWPVEVLVRGETAFKDDVVVAAPGNGKFVRCERSGMARPLGRSVHGFEPSTGAFAPWS